MSGFIDRLAEFLRDILGSSGESKEGGEASARQGYTDPDLRDAWNELNDYMNTGRERGGSQRARRPPRSPDESLRQDYANLEVPFGADMEVVLRSYKTLMMRYHPDKHAGNPEKQRVALEITKKINESFERIRSGGNGRSSPS